MKQIINILKWIVILIILLGLAGFVYVFMKVNEPHTTEAQEIVFVVEPGWATNQVAERLEAEGLIDRALFFKFYVYFKKQGSQLKAGRYVLSSDMSIREIVNVIAGGKALSTDVKFTVIEGWTLADIARALEESGIVKQRDFLKLSAEDFQKEFTFLSEQPAKYASLEGYLFPDTYLFAKDSQPVELAGKMLANFDRKVTGDLREESKNKGQNLYEIVTLASVIEREVGRNLKKGTRLEAEELEKLRGERRLVAGVFYNRLKAGMLLESDATVAYITGRKGNRATIEETKIDSPYNTYKYPGLPAGPIANPSLDSILAAIYPAKTDYFYFLMAIDGTAHFARTLEEHRVNRAKYLE